MNRADITYGILLCIKSSLKWDISLMNTSGDLMKDYGADSFEIFLLCRKIKNYFQLSVSEERLKEYRSIDELTKFVMKLKQSSDTKCLENNIEGG